MADELPEPKPPKEPSVHPLGYARPEVPPRIALKLIGGLAAGVAVVTLIGVLVALGSLPRGRAGGIALASIFGVISVICFRLARSSWQARTAERTPWLELGLLLGLGIACLLEGLCFGTLDR
jgi:hypothetical protein